MKTKQRCNEMENNYMYDDYYTVDQMKEAYARVSGLDLEECEDFAEHYRGMYNSPEEFCEKIISGVYSFDEIMETLPDFLQYCIDWHKVWEDYLKSDYSFDKETGMVFTNN